MTLVLAVVSGLVKFRSLVFAAVLVALLWPPLFNLRNQRRVDVGANVAELGSDQSSNRLELNKYFEELPVFESGGRRPDVDLLEVLRFGFIPRVLRSRSGNLSTGNDLERRGEPWREELGHAHGVRKRLPLGRWYPRRALLFDFGRRDRHRTCGNAGPAIAFLVFGLVLLNFVWIEAVWPDSIGFLHSEHDLARFRNGVSSCPRAERSFDARAREPA